MKRMTVATLLLACAFAHASEDQAQTMLEIGDLMGAQRVLQAVLSAQPDNVRAISIQGQILMNLDQLDEAIELAEDAVREHGDVSELYRVLGESYGEKAQRAGIFSKMGLAKKSRKYLEKAVTVDPANVKARYALAHFYLSAPGIVGGSEDKASEQLEALHRINPSWALVLEGDMATQDDDLDGASALYIKAIQADTDALIPRLTLAAIYSAAEDYGNAYEQYRDILARWPEHRTALYQLGRVASESGGYLDEGLQAFVRYLELMQNDPEGLHAWSNYRMGLIYQHKGEPGHARSHFQKAVNLDKNHKQAKKALAALD